MTRASAVCYSFAVEGFHLLPFADLLDVAVDAGTGVSDAIHEGGALEPGDCFSGFFVAHPVQGIDAAFRNLISEVEIQRMKDSLGSPNLSLNEMIPFDGEPVALGTPTSEGKKGKKFRRILQSS